MNKSRLHVLFDKYFDKTASPAERAELGALISLESQREEAIRLLGVTWENYEGEDPVFSENEAEEILKQIFLQSGADTLGKSRKAKSFPRVRKLSFRGKIAAAASILLLITGGYRLWKSYEGTGDKHDLATAVSKDVRPGVYKAKLILADGTRITLDSAGPGQVAQQGGTKVINTNGNLVYRQSGARLGPVLYNTLATGKGESYSFSLADGSKVWLNSGSSIHYPVAFLGKQRRVDVTGEVFVQVAKDPSKTFIATVDGLEVSALGTAFDINAYADEEHISATLVEGAVKVAKGGETTVLHPGQQTSLQKDGHLSEPVSTDVDQVVSWKDGNFQFENADVRTILRQFARWYDVEVEYDGSISERKYYGLISRSNTLASVLQMFKDSGISFRIEGQKLYVTSSAVKQ